MKVAGQPTQTIWLHPTRPEVVCAIDQRDLPHIFRVVELTTWQEAAAAIEEMLVRGAPLIGITAAFGMYLAARAHAHLPAPAFKTQMQAAQAALAATRPTAVNLHWALSHCAQALQDIRYSPELAVGALLELAQRLRTEDIAQCRAIGEHGLAIIREVAACKPGQPVRVLTHCNAGWLGCVDYGTATAPLYLAHDAGIPLEVWVDETRPRNQGSNLTAWELGQHGIPHHLIVDNTGGHLMQHGLVDLCIVGTDRVTRTGDVANKIGTYLKALAAKDNGVPFYVAAPSSSIDFELTDGIREIPIETRSPDEVRYVQGWADGRLQQVRICPEDTPAVNYGFDVTPARLVTALITERGVCLPIEEKISALFADRL